MLEKKINDITKKCNRSKTNAGKGFFNETGRCSKQQETKWT